MSTVEALRGKPLNAEHLLSLKRRLDARGAAETPGEAQEEEAAMRFEAMDRAERARGLRDDAAALVAEARREEAEAMTLANAGDASAVLRMGR
jgi:hypothetical protein